jgi:sigma-E factor negative regulatory protein RseA
MGDSMTDQVRDQISAFLDDELSADESAFLVRRLERDAEARQTMRRYATIGAALKGDLVYADPDLLRRRVALRLDGGQAPGAQAEASKPALRRWPLAGVGLVVGVGMLALLLLRFDGFGSVGDPAAGDQATAAAVPVPSYAVERPARPASVVQPSVRPSAQPIRLTNYLVHHGEFATRLGQPWIHSNVISSRDIQGQEEETSWRQ